MIICQSVTEQSVLQKIYFLRSQVFVEEQGVSAEEEFDEFEETSIHWAANLGDEVIACARYRRTEKGFKIERMAVREDFRKQGIGRYLLSSILETLRLKIALSQQAEVQEPKPEIYLHAQVQALPFYLAQGFVQVGEIFYEACIPHYRCIFQDFEGRVP